MGNPFEVIGAGLGGLLGQGQAAQLQGVQNQIALLGLQGTIAGNTLTSSNTTITSGSTYGIGLGETYGREKQKLSETALAWLDRRVEEMRVKL